MNAARRSKPATTRKPEDSPAPVLSARAKQDLRARAHHLQPTVQIGHGGVHDAAIAAVRLALRDHELIKVRLHEPEDKRSMAQALADSAQAVLCGLVGHTVILYKPKPKPKAVRADPKSPRRRTQARPARPKRPRNAQ